MNCPNGNHDSERFALYDAMGIFVAYACDTCEDDLRGGYAPHVFGDSSDYIDAAYAAGETIDEEEF